jgi:hypothetical protein
LHVTKTEENFLLILPDGVFGKDEIPGEFDFLPDGQGSKSSLQGDLNGSVT